VTGWRYAGPLLLLCGCYDSRSVKASDVVQIEAPATAIADGQSLVDVTVVVDPRTASDTSIDVEVSQGVIALAADADSADARKLSLKNLGGGRLPLKVRPGTAPGDLLITVSVAGQVATQIVELRRSRAAELSVEADKRSITADGETGLSITVQLAAASPETAGAGGAPAEEVVPLVSLGEVVRFSVCCVDAAGDLSTCSKAPPLQVPARSELKEGQSLTIRAVADRISGTEDAPEEQAAVIAEIQGKIAPTCESFMAPLKVTQGRIDVTLRRILPM
jgi:hypothetical protein